MSLAVALSDAFASRPDPAAVPAASIAVVVDQHTVIEAWGAKTSTLFQAASVSKPVAAMVALRLVADGHLDLDADDGRPPSNTSAVRREGPPGRESRYSGGGYQILQQLLEDATGQAFADLAEELVLSALAGGPGAVLPQELAEQMVTRQLADWGLGLGVSGDGDRRTFSHAGGNYGYQCLMFGAVDVRNAAAVMTNSDQGLSVAKAMAAAIMASTSWQIT